MPRRAVGTPTAADVSAHLRQLIAQDDGTGKPLPTEESLAAQFNVTRMTVRSAFQQLVSAGMVVRRPGIGTVVAPRVVEDLNEMAFQTFPKRWAVQGVDISLRTLSFELRPAPVDVGRLFGVGQDDPLCFVERVRYVGSIPIMYDRRYLPASTLAQVGDEDLEHESLTSVLIRGGAQLRDSQYQIYGRLAEEDEAKYLQIRHDSTVIVRENIVYDTSNAVMMWARSAHPAYRVGYRVTMDLRGNGTTLPGLLQALAGGFRALRPGRESRGQGGPAPRLRLCLG